MIAEVVSIGDELTSGQRLDTNSQWLSQRLGEIGLRVMYHTTVADDLAAGVQAFRTAVERADVIVATGGLGPTADDLTRDVLAEVSGRELVLDQEQLERIRAMFAFFGRDMPERNRVQAMFPAGCRIVPNNGGTAPGIDLQIPRAGGRAARVFALPGVPAEMHQMWAETVGPALRELTGAPRVIVHRQIKCFGAGESHVESMLPDLIRRGRTPSVGITVSDATITLRVTAEGETLTACEALVAPTIETIRQCLGELVFGSEDDELEHAVARLLIEGEQTLAVAEWGTGGLVAHWLGRVPESAGRFLGGYVTTSPESFEPILGMSLGGELDDVGIEATVRAMAEGCRDRSGADLALAVGPLPPLVRTAKEAPRVMFALADEADTIVRSAPFVGHPSMIITRTAKQALNLVRLALLRRS